MLHVVGPQDVAAAVGRKPEGNTEVGIVRVPKVSRFAEEDPLGTETRYPSRQAAHGFR